MKRMLLISLAATILASGCATSKNSTTSTLEGSWTGREVTPGRESPASIAFKGHDINFLGADSDAWLKGTFVVDENTNPKEFIATVTDCESSELIGKKSYVIWKIENATLTLTGNEIGIEEFPKSFTAPDSRQFIFKRDR